MSAVAESTAAKNGNAAATGEILQITGPVVDVQFPADMLPEIYNALQVTKDDGTILTLETQSHLGNDAVRAVAMSSTDGLRRGAKVVVSVRHRDGRSFEAIATAEHPRVEIARAAPSSFLAFVRLGLEHVATGLDHVAFVCGLFLIVGANRRLVATITAFTVAHSLTLALAAFDVVALPRAPVEATIAASVLLVAVEATSRRRTWTKRRPWLVAFAFGLVHGLGFAGALGELGLPHAALPKTLLAFNVGVEIAQLALVGVLVAAERAFLAKKRPRTALAYAIGTFGAYWLVERTVAMFTSAS